MLCICLPGTPLSLNFNKTRHNWVEIYFPRTKGSKITAKSNFLTTKSEDSGKMWNFVIGEGFPLCLKLHSCHVNTCSKSSSQPPQIFTCSTVASWTWSQNFHERQNYIRANITKSINTLIKDTIGDHYVPAE